MPQALDPAAYIFEGIWTNWTKADRLRGLTLTLAPTRATLLTNSLALFFALAGGQLWTIIRFIFHQLYASRHPEKSGLIHDQQQVILRNATTDLTTTQLMWTLAWTSRRAGKPYSRPVYIGLVALFHAVLFIVGGTFSSQLASAGPDVLSKSPHCGVWNLTYWNIAFADGPSPSSKENMTLSFLARSRDILDVQLSYEYAQNCYLGQSIVGEASLTGSSADALSPTCNTLKKPKLEWTTNHTSKCPFQAELCHSDSPTLVLDTGDIDSHEDFGINAAPADRLTYRRLTTCTVLNDTGRVVGWDGFMEIASDHPTKHTAYAYYGPNVHKNTTETYAYSNYASFYTNFSAQESAPYHVNPATASLSGGVSTPNADFEPIAEFEQNSVDLTLSFLSYTGAYLTPIDDPWFSAHQKHNVENARYPFMETQYSRDQAVSTIACTEQHKFCNPSRNLCTPFLSYYDVQLDEAFNSSLTPHQNATFDRLTWAIDHAKLFEVVFSLGQTTGRSLLAMESTASSIHVLSLDLPDNQWELEVNYWHSIAMAQLQRTMAQWATGQVAEDLKYLLPPQLEQDVWFCQTLTIPSTVYQSFSLITIILMLLLGILIITVSYTVEDWARWTRKRVNEGAVRWQRWVQDDMLNLPLVVGGSDWKPPPPRKDHSSGASSPSKHITIVSADEKSLVMSQPEMTNPYSQGQRLPHLQGPPPAYHASTRSGSQATVRNLLTGPELHRGNATAPTFWI